jgi:molecular chaperone GrpE
MKRDTEDVEFEIDDDSRDEIVAEESEASLAVLRVKLKTLRDELKKAQGERDEHLAGWQRAKADLVNFRRNVEEDRVRDQARLKGKVIQAVLPTLDSFESAVADKSWGEVEQHWREGVERIKDQLEKSLGREGLVSFGSAGDSFDPNLHECMSVVPTSDAGDETIAQVLQKGYKIGDEVIRPAKVIVFQQQ